MNTFTPLTIGAFSKDINEPVSFVTRTNPLTQEETTYGRVRVEQEQEVAYNSLIVTRKRVAFLTLDEKACAKYADKLQIGLPFPIKGKIVILESLTPAYDKHKPKMNPQTKEYIEVDGQSVYQQQLFTVDMEAQDVLIRKN